MINPIDTVLARIDAKQTGPGKWLAKCPAHDDRTASLGIKCAADGRVLIHCFAGCHVEQVIDALGLTFADLYPPKLVTPYSRSKSPRKPPKFSAGEMLRLAVFESTVIVIAMRQLLTTKAINELDFQRVEQALDTLHEINAEVRHYG